MRLAERSSARAVLSLLCSLVLSLLSLLSKSRIAFALLALIVEIGSEWDWISLLVAAEQESSRPRFYARGASLTFASLLVARVPSGLGTCTVSPVLWRSCAAPSVTPQAHGVRMVGIFIHAYIHIQIHTCLLIHIRVSDLGHNSVEY